MIFCKLFVAAGKLFLAQRQRKLLLQKLHLKRPKAVESQLWSQAHCVTRMAVAGVGNRPLIFLLEAALGPTLFTLEAAPALRALINRKNFRCQVISAWKIFGTGNQLIEGHTSNNNNNNSKQGG